MRTRASRGGLLVAAAAVLLLPSGRGWAKTKATRGKLTSQEQAELVVSRLTFGATPGEVNRVQRMGVDRWLKQQLHPERIEDAALEEQLQQFPAVQLPTAALLQRLPTPQRMRQTVKRDGGEAVANLPSDADERMIYATQMLAVQDKLAKKKAGESETPVAERAVYELPVGEAETLAGMTPTVRWNRLRAMKPEELLTLSRGMTTGERKGVEAGLTAEQRETFEALDGSERVVVRELTETRMLRDVESRRELEAVMTDFWLNHFSVYLRKKDEAFLLPEWERQIRTHALGHFDDLLEVTAHDPAMLEYLDNEESVGPDSAASAGRAKGGSQRGINENYARELMELHTLGVACEVSADRPAKALPKRCDGGYTQADIRAAAAVLTGWGVDRPQMMGAFRFEPKRHEPGDKKVLGELIPQGGEAEGEALLHRLATSPATAELICHQMAVRFVSDAPPESLVNRMVKRWETTQGDIAEVLWTMVQSPEFRSRTTFAAKVKTPEEFVVSAARASGASVTDAGPLVREVAQLGMPLYGMQTPQGYDWTAGPWVNTGDLLGRMNFAARLAADSVPGVAVAWEGSRNNGARSLGVEERELESQLLEAPVSETMRSTVLGLATDGGAGASVRTVADRGEAPAQDEAVAKMAGLLLGSPEFQRR